MIDPQDYAAIVAKRPELAVPGLAFFTVDNILDTDEAEALIGWHWTRMLPPGVGIVQHPETGKPCIVDTSGGGIEWWPEHPDPLSALTAFWRSQ